MIVPEFSMLPQGNDVPSVYNSCPRVSGGKGDTVDSWNTRLGPKEERERDAVSDNVLSAAFPKQFLSYCQCCDIRTLFASSWTFFFPEHWRRRFSILWVFSIDSTRACVCAAAKSRQTNRYFDKIERIPFSNTPSSSSTAPLETI